MSRTRVKVCGITNQEDAQDAVVAGADALGFVFYPRSPRHVSVAIAGDIMSNLPAFVTTTALFVNPQVADVHKVIDITSIDLLQFHGDESAEFCEQFGRPYIKAIRMQEETDLVALSKEYRFAQSLLLDTYKKGTPGGTGEAFNWGWLSKYCGTENALKHLNTTLILAGGLSADNVVEAIKAVKPWAVDISGGVESMPGKKDNVKMKQFMQAVS